MERLEQYRQLVRQVINQYAQFGPSYGKVETVTVFDPEHDHYQLMHIGWHNNRRVYGIVLHINIKNGKIWLQHNGTEFSIAGELEKLGVPKSDIVLGFQAPYKRPYTDYATGDEAA
jgi:hypothetical protein